jgi:hypothetical protein
MQTESRVRGNLKRCGEKGSFDRSAKERKIYDEKFREQSGKQKLVS